MTPLEAFFTVHANMEQEAPGSPETTRRLLGFARPHLPAAPAVLDLGCGPGAQTRTLLAALPGASVTAVDTHAPFLERLPAGVTPLCVDFGDVAALPAGNDLVWSEGALYNLGTEVALRRWKGLLRPGGVLAFTEAVWLTDAPSPELRALWDQEYPLMTDTAGVLRLAAEAGYEVLGHFVLPAADWWAYYRPLLARCDALEPGAGPALRQAIQETRDEAEMYRRDGHAYGYVAVACRA